MSRLLGCAVLVAALTGGALLGCSVSPAEQDAIRRAWAAHDAQIAAECRRNGVGYAAGGCVAGGQ